MLKRILLMIAMCSTTSMSFANDVQTNVIGWKDGDNPLSTLVTKYSGDIETMSMVGAEVAHSHQGVQRLYFNFITFDKNDFCNPEKTNNTATVNINGQPIRVSQQCYPESINGLDVTMIQATALTDQGVEFVFNSFKNSRNTVNLQFDVYEANLSAVGFTHAWNLAGGDAL
ncbi:hypothetical protein AB4086_02100 [Vibrio splendidus]|jgi:hypothetical protein